VAIQVLLSKMPLIKYLFSPLDRHATLAMTNLWLSGAVFAWPRDGGFFPPTLVTLCWHTNHSTPDSPTQSTATSSPLIQP